MDCLPGHGKKTVSKGTERSYLVKLLNQENFSIKRGVTLLSILGKVINRVYVERTKGAVGEHVRNELIGLNTTF